MKAKHQK